MFRWRVRAYEGQRQWERVVQRRHGRALGGVDSFENRLKLGWAIHGR